MDSVRYKPLSTESIAQMNEIKEHGARLQALCDKLFVDKDTDKRWVAIGRTHLQEGLMALTRGVANPSFF